MTFEIGIPNSDKSTAMYEYLKNKPERLAEKQNELLQPYLDAMTAIWGSEYRAQQVIISSDDFTVFYLKFIPSRFLPPRF